MAHRKNPAAVALGRLGGKVGGKAKTKAKIAASRSNGAQHKHHDLPCRKCGTKTKKRDASRRADCGCDSDSR